MKRLLIVDDEKIYQKMIYHAVENLDFEIEVVDDGEKAVISAQERLPNLIITDVMMPNLNGFDLVRQLRRSPRFAQVPILVLTGQAELSNKLEAFEAGADDYMTKPFEPAELQARLQVLLRRAEAFVAMQHSNAAAMPKARLIAVHSLRGGVGCSSLVVNLGLALARLKKNVLVLDLVLTAGQAALMLNLPLKRTWADIAYISPDELDWDALQTVVGKHDSGVHLIAAPTFPTEAELISHDLFRKALMLLRAQFDFIVCDLPHDFSRLALETLDVAHVVLAPLAPEVASVRAALASLDTYRKLEYPREKIKLVLNWLFERKGLRRAGIETALDHPIDLALPFAPELFVEAINHGTPWFYEKPTEKVSQLVLAFARQLVQEAERSAATAAAK